jgi:hypothetical protein
MKNWVEYFAFRTYVASAGILMLSAFGSESLKNIGLGGMLVSSVYFFYGYLKDESPLMKENKALKEKISKLEETVEEQ